MTDIDSLAAALFGSKRAETQEVLTDATTRTYVGTALTDSKDGTVMVDLGGDVTLPDDVEGVSEHSAEGIEVSTGPGVRAGDEVVVTLVGGTPLKTPMVTGVAGEGDGQNERIHAIEADYVKASTLEADVADIGFLKADSATIKDMQADTAKVHDLTADQLSAATAYIASLNAKSVTAETLAADVAKVHDLTADQLSAAAAYIAQLSADSVTAQRIAAISGDFDAVRANAAKVANLTAAELEADHATIGSLDANYAKITNGHIDSALIDTAAIVDEQVFTVTGNKATISEINAGNIRVRNLHTSNLTVDTADGYVTIGNKQTPTKEFLDSLKDELQQEIDGAVETFTSSAVPLLNNYPASEWVISGATAEEQRKAYAKHVGDICYVQNSALDQNGYAYRFAYDSTEQTFKWVLIKDSDVTKALGDISDLKTFESDTTTWMNETDEGLTTIRQNHTALSGVVDKTVVETKQLWYTKANTTAPSKPTAQVTSTSTAGNAWRVVVPAYNASYPNYYYCLQYKLADGTYAWSDVVRDIAMGESQQQGRKGVADAATAQSTADSATTAAATADGKAVSAQTTANANIKSSVQLWFTKANTTAPNKPTAQVTVNDATKTNQWNLAIPTYSSSYPNYFYCYQQQKGDGTWQWTDVVYDRSITEAQAKAQSALPSSEFNTFKTTTFKEVVDEVDEHSTSISTLSESVSNKADQSTVTTLSNTVNAVKQTADTNKASITNLTQTVNNKADGSTVTTLTNRVSTVEQNLSGITTRVGKTESELDTVSNPNLTPYFSRDKGDVYNASTNPSGYWKTISANYITALDDGWVHISASNSGTSNLFVNYFTAKTSVPKDLVASTKYTFLVETRGVTKSGNVVVYASHHFGSELHAFTSSAGYNVSGEESKYFTVTSASDLSSIACFTRGYVQVPSHGSVDMDIRISLYEGEYSGPYKPYVDQTLSSRVKSAETAIEQNAEDITLRATKTEVYQSAQPNLSPYFQSTPITTDGGYWLYFANSYATFTPTGDGWCRIVLDNKSGTSVKRCDFGMDACPSVEPGKDYTLLYEVRNLACSGSGAQTYVVQAGNELNRGIQFWGNSAHMLLQGHGTNCAVNYINTASGSGGDHAELCDDGIYRKRVVRKSEASDSTYYTRATDKELMRLVAYANAGAYIDVELRVSLYPGVYTGPYKPYSGAQVYASQAELKVANDNINLKVSKNDVINQINVSTEGAKIDADRVEINGTAIFSAIKSSADAAYDAKGAAATVQDNLDNLEVGGRNLLLATGTPQSKTMPAIAAGSYTTWDPYKLVGAYNTLGLSAGDSITISFDWSVTGAAANSTIKMGTNVDPWEYFGVLVTFAAGASSGHVVKTYTVSSKLASCAGTTLRARIDAVGTAITTSMVLTLSNVKLEKGNKATDWTPAPEDIEASAVKRTQRIWYRTNASSAPSTPGTASSNWVTKADDGNDAWTKMHIAISSTHKYIYTCEQYEMANGTVGYTSVLLDNTITVIDGGNIITGSVTANKLNAANINASKTLTVGAMTDAAASTILNSNVQIGGRNLLPKTGSADGYYANVVPSGSNLTTVNDDGECYERSVTSASANIPMSSNAALVGLESGSEYTLSMMVKSTVARTFGLQLRKNNNGADGGEYVYQHGVNVAANTWTRLTYSFTGTSDAAVYARLYCAAGTACTVRMRELKLERGNKATDWTPAPEDTTASVDQTYVQNLTPYFLTDMTQTSDEYWANLTYERFSRLGDGWAHFEYTNSGSSTANNYIKPKVLDFLEPGGKYTLLIEFKNVSISKDGGTFYSQQGNDVQVWGDSSYCGFSIPNATIRALSGGVGTFYKTLTLLTADSKDPSGTVRGSLPKTSFMSINSQVAAGQTVSYDLRLSLYEDGYTGPYKPYTGSQLYAYGSDVSELNASLIATEESLGGQIQKTNDNLGAVSDAVEQLNTTVQQDRANMGRWLNFNESEGLTIGKAGSAFKVVTDETRQAFMYGNETLAYTSGDRFVAPRMEADELHIGNWMWVKRDNGNLSLKWIG